MVAAASGPLVTISSFLPPLPALKYLSSEVKWKGGETLTATCSPSEIAPVAASDVKVAMDVEGGGGSDAPGWEDPPLLLLLLLIWLLPPRPPPIGLVAAVFPVPTLADSTAAPEGRVVAGGMTLCRKIQSYVPSPLLCRYPWKIHREAKETKARAAATV